MNDKIFGSVFPQLGFVSLIDECPVQAATGTGNRNDSLVRLSTASLDEGQLSFEIAEWSKTFSSWNNTQKLVAIGHLMEICNTVQIHHTVKVLQPKFQRDFILLLPKELSLYVLSFLEPKELVSAGQTCKYWRTMTEDNLLWREKCREGGLSYFNTMSTRVRRSRQDIPASILWKGEYIKESNIESNLRRREIKPIVLKGHDDHVITCIQFGNNKIVTGSDDNTLKVWCSISGNCMRTLIGHHGGVWCSKMLGDTVVSGSTDRTLRVWSIESGLCRYTLFGHTSTVRCLHLVNNTAVSGSRDCTLRLWNVDTGNFLKALIGHEAAIRCVQYDGKLVISGSYDFSARIWNPHTGECLHILSGHTKRVYSLLFDGVHIMSGSLDSDIRVWNAQTGVCERTLVGHESLTSGMELRGNLLVSGNADSTAKIWNISTGECLRTMCGANQHNGAITSIQIIHKFVVTASDDGTVKLWDFESGEFVRNLISLHSAGNGGVIWKIKRLENTLICAGGSRNGTEETKILFLDFGYNK